MAAEDVSPANAPGSAVGSQDNEIAREAAALGPASGSLADAASDKQDGAALSSGPVGGESVGTGAGRGEAGSGLPRNRGELGGGALLGQQSGSGPAGSDGGNLP